MFRNNLKIAWRILTRNRINTLINVFSLSLGICGCIVIWLVARHELSFDKFHPDAERIFRVGSGSKQAVNKTAFIVAPMPGAIRESIPAVDRVTAIFPYTECEQVKVPASSGRPAAEFENKVTGEDGMPTVVIADSDWFSIFKYQWLAGNPVASMKDPFTVVLTENRAQRYFGRLAPEAMIGREVTYEDSLHVRVSGIVKDWQGNTDLPYTDFISLATINASFLKQVRKLDNWAWMYSPGVRDWPACYVRLAPGATREQVESRLKAVGDQVRGSTPSNPYLLQLQPLADIHFNTDYSRDYIRKAHLPTLYALMAIALFILLLSAVNFINLSTAQSLHRVKEIGVRKVLGSGKMGVIFQFLTEALVVVVLSVLVAVMLVNPVLAFFREYLPPGVHFVALERENFLFLAGLTLATGLIAGLYPARVLASYRPIENFRGSGLGPEGGKWWLRKGLIVFQFTISLVFIMATLVIGNQIRYMLSADYGFKSDAIVSVHAPTKWGDSSALTGVFVQKLKGISGIREVVREGLPPIGDGSNRTGITLYQGKDAMDLDVNYVFADDNYLSFYGMKVIAGRNYRLRDSLSEFVINETLARRMGFSQPGEAVGHFLDWGHPYPIVGVIADFHQESFKQEIQPVMITYGPAPWLESWVGIKLASSGKSTQDVQATLTAVGKIYHQLYPRDDFSFHFMDDSIANLYQQELHTALLVRTAMSLAIFISSMGLFGLALFTARRRAAEIGIRKVLGATVGDVVILLNKDFVKLVLLALVISTPLAWWLTNRWLQDFAYRTPVPLWIIPAAGSGAILIALLTVSIQSVRAARANPARTLRTD